MHGGTPPHEWLHHFLPGRIQLVDGSLALPGKDLPKSNIGLKRSQRIRTQSWIRNAVDSIGRTYKLRDRAIIKTRKLGKDSEPMVELRKPARHQFVRLI